MMTLFSSIHKVSHDNVTVDNRQDFNGTLKLLHTPRINIYWIIYLLNPFVEVTSLFDYFLYLFITIQDDHTLGADKRSHCCMSQY